jgi:hypothetical protein
VELPIPDRECPAEVDVIAFRMDDNKAGVALGGGEIREIRSGTGCQLVLKRIGAT